MAYEQGIEDPDNTARRCRSPRWTRVDVVGDDRRRDGHGEVHQPVSDMLEGRFAFDLPPGAVVTGYALDIEGTLIDGVLVDPLKARREYEEQVRENIDPGVAEVSRANRFSTTLYPIGAGSRTIRLRFSAPIHPELGFTIPLATRKPVGRFPVEVRATRRGGGAGADVAARIERELARRGFRLSSPSASDCGVPLSGELRIAPVVPSNKGLITRHANGKRMFQIVDSVAIARGVRADWQRLRVYWDRSCRAVTIA